MKEIELTQGRVALVDDEDYETLAQFKWTLRKNRGCAYAYRTAYRGGTRRTVLMHRQIIGVPRGVEVDHVNGDGLDNRRSNLRPANRSQNCYNMRRRRNRSGYKGVRFHSTTHRAKPWYATIKACGEQTFLGYFSTAEDAARAYDEAAIKIHGRFARLNFPAAQLYLAAG